MLDSNTIKSIKNIVEPFLPNNSYKVFIFGSRAAGTNRPFSDIDLGILGLNSLPNKNYIELTQALEESDLPFRTNVVDFTGVSDKFKKKALAKIIKL